jgi:hypothetical protein
MVKCQRDACGACPHGPYGWLRWRDDEGKEHEYYLGRIPQQVSPTLQVKWLGPIRSLPQAMPEIGGLVTLDPSVRWGLTGPGDTTLWHGVVSTFRIDGHGVGRMGRNRAPTIWVTLRTTDGQRIYRPKSRRKNAPADERWPIQQISVVAERLDAVVA